MAKRDLFETARVLFLELIGNGKRYRVPPYQRDYSWGEEQWEDLWNDIKSVHEDSNARHYMGALVVDAESDRDFLVIDGQQRLATLSILAICVVDALRELSDREIDPVANKDRAELLESTFIGDKDAVTLIRSSKLALNETDNGFYQDFLVQSRPPVGLVRLPKSNQSLYAARNYFNARVRELAHEDGEALARLLLETVARRLVFILITVEDEANAYTIFETLNARGLELSTTDLLKNYLFSRMTPGPSLAHVQRQWKSLIDDTTQERFSDFLRYHLLVSRRQVRKENLFKIVRNEVKDPGQATRLIEELRPRAQVFAALRSPYHPYWEGDSDLQRHIEELNLFGARQVTPLVFAATERLGRTELASVLRTLVIVSFRYTVVGGRNTNELEPIYHEAAESLMSGRAKTPKEVFAALRPIYVSNEAFGSEFAVWSISRARGRLAKYVLVRLESDMTGRSMNAFTDPASVEHILPENPEEIWAKSIEPEAWERTVDRVGNLTLLEPPVNRRLGNSAYSEKLPAYRASNYEMTQAVAQRAPEEWTLAHIEERQRAQAARAVHLWRVDF